MHRAPINRQNRLLAAASQPFAYVRACYDECFDALLRSPIKTPTSFIVHSRRFAGLGRSWADKGPDSVAAHLTGAHTPATLDSNPDSLIQVYQAEWQVPSRHVILLRQRGGKLVGETGSGHR